MNTWIENFMDWSIKWVFAPMMVLFILCIIFIFVGGAGYGIYWIVKTDDPKVTQKEKYVEIKPYYWSCTGAYLSRHSGYTGGGKISRSYYDYVTCECKQWTAHMVNKEVPADVTCSDGSKPTDVIGFR